MLYAMEIYTMNVSLAKEKDTENMETLPSTQMTPQCSDIKSSNK